MSEFAANMKALAASLVPDFATNPITGGLKTVFYLAFIIYGIFFISKVMQAKKNNEWEEEPVWKPITTGFVTNFLDTLGIGSFAPTMFLFKALKHNIPDKKIPGTLNVADTFPVLFEAIIFTAAVDVDPITLITLILAAVIGSYVGAGIVSKMNEKTVQLIMGIALLISAGLFLAGILKIMPLGGTAIALHGVKLIITAVIFLFLGGLMTAGVGLYAPAMIVIALMGMNVATAFPIMMGSCALLMPVCGTKFIKEDSYAKKNSLFIALSGLVGVFIAYLFFQGLPMEYLKILVVVVVFLTALMMLKSAFKKAEK